MALLPWIPFGPYCLTSPDFTFLLLLLLLSCLFWVTEAGRSRSSCLSECVDVVRFIVSWAGQILGLCWRWGCYSGCSALLCLLLITANKHSANVVLDCVCARLSKHVCFLNDSCVALKTDVIYLMEGGNKVTLLKLIEKEWQLQAFIS